jgi:hypothetical protein
MIFPGKTAASLPSHDVLQDPMYKRFLFQYTPNHWCTLQTKVELVVRLYEEWVASKVAAGVERSAAVGMPCVLLLDCWPVNLSAPFRKAIQEKCPGLIILYLPAGATGSLQVRTCGPRRCPNHFLAALTLLFTPPRIS